MKDTSSGSRRDQPRASTDTAVFARRCERLIRLRGIAMRLFQLLLLVWFALFAVLALRGGMADDAPVGSGQIAWIVFGTLGLGALLTAVCLNSRLAVIASQSDDPEALPWLLAALDYLPRSGSGDLRTGKLLLRGLLRLAERMESAPQLGRSTRPAVPYSALNRYGTAYVRPILRVLAISGSLEALSHLKQYWAKGRLPQRDPSVAEELRLCIARIESRLRNERETGEPVTPSTAAPANRDLLSGR